MNHNIYPGTDDFSGQFINGVNSLTQGIEFDANDEKATELYELIPGMSLSRIAARATHGRPHAVQVRKVAYITPEGADEDYILTFYERLDTGMAIRFTYTVADGEPTRHTAVTGSNQNAKTLGRLASAEMTDENKRAAHEAARKLRQDIAADERIAAKPEDDPEGFAAAVEFLGALKEALSSS